MENITKLINLEYEYSAIKQKKNKNPTCIGFRYDFVTLLVSYSFLEFLSVYFKCLCGIPDSKYVGSQI